MGLLVGVEIDEKKSCVNIHQFTLSAECGVGLEYWQLFKRNPSNGPGSE